MDKPVIRVFQFFYFFGMMAIFANGTDGYAQTNYQIRMRLITEKPEVRAGEGSLEFAWGAVQEVDRYYMQYTSDAKDTKFKGEHVKNDTITDPSETTYKLRKIEIDKPYLIRVGFGVDGQDGTTWGPVQEFGIYESAQASDAPDKGLWVFFSAILSSFATIEIVGITIVTFILLLLVWGVFLIFFKVRRRVKEQDHTRNKQLYDLLLGKKGIVPRWKSNVGNLNGLKSLQKDIEKQAKTNGVEYSFQNVLETGLRNQIDNFSRDNVSQEVDRDMEKVASCEKDRLTMGLSGNGGIPAGGSFRARIGRVLKMAVHATTYTGVFKRAFDKRSGSLSTVRVLAEVSPMLGLFGTVGGLVVAFYTIYLNVDKGGVDQTQVLRDLSGGIYSAIITTIFGLLVGMILLALYNWQKQRIDNIYHQWEMLYIDISPLINPHENGNPTKAVVKRTARETEPN